MRLGQLIEGRFIERLNRFAALVEIEGQDSLVHVANSGRIKELLVHGNRVLVRPVDGAHRKTAFDLALVDLGGILCSADARLPPFLIQEAIEQGRLPQFNGYNDIIREATYGESRLDLLLKGQQSTCYIETKSVTLVVDGIGLFPDAPTIRGTKHVASLARAVGEGHRASVIFVVQREDAEAMTPNDAADPQFGAALRKAAKQGVEAYAYRCHVTTEQIRIADEIPVRL